MANKRCQSGALLHGKTVIITGANTGIGKETARDLANRGARVIMACRSLERGMAAAKEIKNEAKGELVVQQLDLASFKSIRNFASQIIETEERVDILINNAGIFCAKATTEDGFDMQFGTNHLGHFLLTYLLVQKLKSSAPSRIITVASTLHSRATMEWEDLNMEKPDSYAPVKAYAQSKLANILFTKELARRLKGSEVSVYAVHPGGVRTDIDRHFYDTFPFILVWLYNLATKCLPFLWKTSEQGAQTTIHCAVTEELAHQSGLYYSDCRVTQPAPQAMEDEAARRLWDISLQMTGIQN